MGVLSTFARNVAEDASRRAARSVARGSERGAAKQALKDQYMEEGMTAVQASNRANYETAKAAGKPTALEKMEVKQARGNSEFVSPRDAGGSETLQLARRNTTTGRKVATNNPNDTAVRSVAKRQESRAKGEAMYRAGVEEEMGRRGIVAATAGTAGAAAGKKMYDDNEKSKEESKKASSRKEEAKEPSSKDERVNKEDYPEYSKNTKSASTFRESFKEAKEAGKDSFTFEGRKYTTEDGGPEKMAKGGVVMKANCGASVPATQKFRK